MPMAPAGPSEALDFKSDSKSTRSPAMTVPADAEMVAIDLRHASLIASYGLRRWSNSSR